MARNDPTHRNRTETANSLVASAKLLTARKGAVATPAKWQDEAWGYHDTVGELRFGTAWLSNALSRVRLTLATRPDAGDEPTALEPDDNRNAYLDQLAGGQIGQAQLLSAICVQLTIPGIGYIVGEPVLMPNGEIVNEWRVLSADEFGVRGDGETARYTLRDETGKPQLMHPDTLAVKVWRQHPRYHSLPDSPIRAALPILRELSLLTMHVDATATSRLAGAGILFVPTELVFPVSERNKDAEDPFVAELMDVMLTPIADRDNASAVVPMVVKVPAEYLSAIKHISFSTPFDEKAMALRDEAIRRFATAMDLPAEILTGMGNPNHWCTDADTEAMTKNGWKRHDALTIGEPILTLNHETGQSEWHPVTDMYVAEVVDEPMLAIEGRGHSSLTTLNHRWPVITNGARRKWVTSETLREYSLITTGAVCADAPVEAKWSDDFVEILAWFWTEGSLTRSGAITIAQSHGVNPDRVARIRDALGRLLGKPSTKRLSSGDWPEWRESIQANESSFGGPVTIFTLNAAASVPWVDWAPGKIVIPLIVTRFTRSQLLLFIDVSLQGDGWHYRSGHMDIFQKNPDALDALEVAGVLAGFTPTRRRVVGGWRLNLARKSTQRPVKAARHAARHGSTSTTMTDTTYTGTIWCPVTATSTWLARRNGTVFYTGNSAWQIEESALKMHVEPVAEIVCEALTIGFLQPTLEAAGRADPDLMVWYDTTELTARPNQSADAVQVFDRNGISIDALRHYMGFTDTDSANAQELLTQRLWNLVTNAPSLAPLILPLLGVDLPDVYDDPTAVPPVPPVPPTEPVQPVEPVAPVEPLPIPQTQPDAAEAGMLAAADALVFRAMERCGGRLRNAARRDGLDTDLIPTAELHTRIEDATVLTNLDHLLAGAWDRVPDVAERYDFDPDTLRGVLDGYTRGMIVARRAHTYNDLAKVFGA